MNETQTQLAGDIKQALVNLEYDVTRRNTYMNERDQALYSNGLYAGLDIESWFAEYNYCTRVVDIHSAQLMGRAFNIYSYYNKEDLSPYENSQDPNADEELAMAEMRNKKAKANADARKRIIEGIIRDNGGYAIFKDGARIGSAYGTTVYKQWWDPKAKTVRQVLIESPQNYRAGWTDTDFRERDFDAYIYQISADKAYRDYGSKLPAGAVFETSKEGLPWGANIGDNRTDDPLGTLRADAVKAPETERPMVTVIDIVGYLQGYGVQNGEIVKVPRGKETRIGVTVVGGYVVQTITNEDQIPKYYIIANRVEPRRAWGASDLPQSALDINREIIQLEADSITWANKNLFKLIQAKGFTPDAVPKKKPRRQQLVAMSPEQSLEEMQITSQPLQEFRALIESKLEAFVRVTGIGRVLFDDPTVNANSNQALMTTLKGVIDIVEDKQSRWEPVIREMFTDALNLAAKHLPQVKAVVDTDEDWFLCIEWPSVLRREDATYQTMWLNLFNAGVISLETYQEKIGIYDTSEEMDRIRDEMKDPITAAVMGRQLGEVAHQAIYKSLGIPPWGYVVPKVQLRGDLAPQEVGNMAHNFNWDQGPYGPAIGPTGNEGMAANDNFVNSGFLNGNPYDGGTANYQGPQPQANPQLTPDQNTGQAAAASQPGSGAPAVSPGGAVNQTNQRTGK